MRKGLDLTERKAFYIIGIKDDVIISKRVSSINGQSDHCLGDFGLMSAL